MRRRQVQAGEGGRRVGWEVEGEEEEELQGREEGEEVLAPREVLVEEGRLGGGREGVELRGGW